MLTFDKIYEVDGFDIIERPVLSIIPINNYLGEAVVLEVTYKDICVERSIFLGINCITKNYASRTGKHMFFSDEYAAFKKASKYFKISPMVMSIFEYYEDSYINKYPDLVI